MKKIAVVVNSRANYGRAKSVMQAIQRRPDLELQLIAGASAVLPRYAAGLDFERDGFHVTETVWNILEGENLLTMAKSTGFGIMGYADVFHRLKPDFVVVVADRFEQLGVAIAAAYQNIRIAHIQGGEVTGSIDESVRHAITKLSHLHFVATEEAGINVVRMGERSEHVFVTGCPSIDLLKDVKGEKFRGFPAGTGIGAELDPEQVFLLVVQHPVTTEYEDANTQIGETLLAVHTSQIQAVWLWPNVDAGSDKISKRLREFHENNPRSKIRFYRNLPPEDYYHLMAHCACLVGNSSSGIREGSYLGTPVVNIGSRQHGRARGENVVNAGYSCQDIFHALCFIPRAFTPSLLYGRGDAGERMALLLATQWPTIQKTLNY